MSQNRVSPKKPSRVGTTLHPTRVEWWRISVGQKLKENIFRDTLIWTHIGYFLTPAEIVGNHFRRKIGHVCAQLCSQHGGGN